MQSDRTSATALLYTCAMTHADKAMFSKLTCVRGAAADQHLQWRPAMQPRAKEYGSETSLSCPCHWEEHHDQL